MRTRADRIRYIREEVLGLERQEDLADRLGVERGAVGNWELGKGISRKNLGKLAQIGGVTIDWIENGGAAPAPRESALSQDAAEPAPRSGFVQVHRGAAVMAFAAAFRKFNSDVSPETARSVATMILDSLVREDVSGFRVDREAAAVGMADATVALILAQAGGKPRA